MSFYKRLAAANVSSTALSLIPAKVQQARLLARNYVQYDNTVITTVLYEHEQCGEEAMRRGADAFALWLAVSRFVATCYVGRNQRGSLIGQCESSLILLAQLIVGENVKHPALEGVEVHDFMEALHDAFDAFAIDLTLTVSNDKESLYADAYIDDDDGDPLGGCSTSAGLKARGEKLMDAQFCAALFERCSQLEGKPLSDARKLFGRISVDIADWKGLLKSMTTKPSKPPMQRKFKGRTPQAIFADLPV